MVFVQGDPADPPYEPALADVLLTRYVLWALPDLDAALSKWVRLLKPEGRPVLVEGRWSTGAGMAPADCQALVRRHREEAAVRRLDDVTLLGRPVEDECYLILSLIPGAPSRGGIRLRDCSARSSRPGARRTCTGP